MAPRGERGWKGGRRETQRQVCHTSYGETCAFLWQLLLLFSPHGWSPVTRTRQDVKPKQQPGELPVCRAGIRRDWRLPVPPRTQTAAGLPGCRQHGCHFVEEKKPVSVKRAAGFPSKGANNANIRHVYTSFSNHYGPQGAAYVSDSDNNHSFILVRFAPCFHGVCAIISTTAPTWPDSSDCAQVEAHTGSTCLFCAIINLSHMQLLFLHFITFVYQLGSDKPPELRRRCQSVVVL